MVRGYEKYFTCRTDGDITVKRVELARDLLWGRVVGLRGREWARQRYGDRGVEDC